jgi:hypothetical protein
MVTSQLPRPEPDGMDDPVHSRTAPGYGELNGNRRHSASVSRWQRPHVKLSAARQEVTFYFSCCRGRRRVRMCITEHRERVLT